MPRRVDREARREEILTAAVRVFAAKGFAATRVEDVARAAGIGKGAVYLYFDSRDALLEAAFEAFAADSARLLGQARDGEGRALDRLVGLLRSVLATLAERPELARVLLDLWAAGRDTARPAFDMAALYREYRALIADLLRQAQAQGDVGPNVGDGHAAVVVGAVEGCVLQWLVDPEVALEELVEPVIEVCLDGLRSQEGR
ncbi:transcriptional regulator, TetR family [Marinactinospora thermotolerans DSM 45154]|uniref:Transcriptional regulator, TetR family n=1 Tax=Marinactinospora thermotolerans DSM 45154 TaxID=1122192 RepID=A0A1T4PKF7_9ACTN|nr:TetR/AcrR family transcriptional regulator [Marinactinospora thermotolerans]SJZ92060.1 transcriptional regulator, TetR family [Marinactinospora thermotolerans DSM 45154]